MACIESSTCKSSLVESKSFRKFTLDEFPVIVLCRYCIELIVNRLAGDDAWVRTYAELERIAVLRLCVDYIPFLSVTLLYTSAVLEDDLLRNCHCPVDHVLDGCVRHVITGYVDITVVEVLLPVWERLRVLVRNRAEAVHCSEDTAYGSCLVVAVESECTADLESLCHVTVTVEH